MKDIRRTVDTLKRRGEVIGMTLGDLVFDQQQLFDVYAASCREMGMTVFQTIGNHDMNHKFADRNHSGDQGAGYAEMNYEAAFGPTDYSFNIGKVHVVTMKNIDYRGKWSYAEAMGDRQLAWLERSPREPLPPPRGGSGWGPFLPPQGETLTNERCNLDRLQRSLSVVDRGIEPLCQD